MIHSISGANYSHQYQLQPIVLMIGPITCMADVSVQLYIRPIHQDIIV